MQIVLLTASPAKCFPPLSVKMASFSERNPGRTVSTKLLARAALSTALAKRILEVTKVKTHSLENECLIA